MEKRPIQLYIRIDLIEEVKAQGKVLSSLINDILPDFVFNSEVDKEKVKVERDLRMAEEEFKESQKKFNKLKKQLEAINTSEQLLKERAKLETLQENEVRFFIEAHFPIERNPSFIDGQLTKYENEFNIKLTNDQFLKKLEQCRKEHSKDIDKYGKMYDLRGYS